MRTDDTRAAAVQLAAMARATAKAAATCPLRDLEAVAQGADRTPRAPPAGRIELRRVVVGKIGNLARRDWGQVLNLVLYGRLVASRTTDMRPSESRPTRAPTTQRGATPTGKGKGLCAQHLYSICNQESVKVFTSSQNHSSSPKRQRKKGVSRTRDAAAAAVVLTMTTRFINSRGWNSASWSADIESYLQVQYNNNPTKTQQQRRHQWCGLAASIC